MRIVRDIPVVYGTGNKLGERQCGCFQRHDIVGLEHRPNLIRQQDQIIAVLQHLNDNEDTAAAFSVNGTSATRTSRSMDSETGWFTRLEQDRTMTPGWWTLKGALKSTRGT